MTLTSTRSAQHSSQQSLICIVARQQHLSSLHLPSTLEDSTTIPAQPIPPSTPFLPHPALHVLTAGPNSLMLLTNLLLRRPIHGPLGIRRKTTQLRLVTTLLLHRAVAPAFISALVVGGVAGSGRRRLLVGLGLGRRGIAACVGGGGVGHCWLWWL